MYCEVSSTGVILVINIPFITRRLYNLFFTSYIRTKLGLGYDEAKFNYLKITANFLVFLYHINYHTFLLSISFSFQRIFSPFSVNCL